MTQRLDGVQMAVLSNRFEGIARAMINTLFRTSRSGVLATARDLSCAIVTKDGEFLAAAESLPIHVIGADLAAGWLAKLHPELHRGDAFLNNSPYHGNTHPADHSILVPVVDEEGRHHFTVYAKAHVADCGASRPTTYSSTARDVYDEGSLIFPHVKVQEDYRDCEDVIRMCRMRIRVADDWWGDFLAQIGAARIGERLILELAQEYGWETLHAYTETWFDYSERLMVEAIRDLPAGRAAARTAHDPFPGLPEGIPLNVEVDVRSDEGLVEVDLRDNLDCLPCGFNMTEAYGRGAAIIAVLNSLRHPVPPNAGSFRRVRVHLRENCVAGIPRHPASCSSGMSPTDRIINAIQRAIAELGEGVGMAEAGVNMPPAFGVLSGLDPRAGGAPFINQLILPAVTGGAGTPVSDGWLLNAVPVVSGSMLRDSVEMDELRHPIRIEAQHIIPDSEGAGRFRGAPGAYVEYGPVGCAIDVMYTTDGTITPALGARGGFSGGLARQYKREVTGGLVEASPERARLEAGETIVSISCGGGGYGPPTERDPERVRHDVIEGWITGERAAAVYGVVLTPTGEIDPHATATTRRRIGTTV